MPGCTPPCVEIQEGWTTRQKWNYVKNLYMPSYDIDSNGNYVDPRDAGDVARISSEAKYDGMYNTDLAAWQARILGGHNEPFERFLQWQYQIGTTMYGNLPQHKKHDHVGHCWMPCPYSTDSSAERSVTMLGFSVGTKVDHGIYYMKTQARGSVWGYECTFDSCPYYIGENIRYFYV